MVRSPRQPYRAPALEKGLDLLELLAASPHPLTTAQITEALGRSRSEIFRMQSVLEDRGYIRRAEGSEGYLLTTRLFEMAMQSPPTAYLLSTALPVMERLAEAARQSVHLAVVSDDQTVVIARVESPSDVGFAVRIGHRRSIVESTSGRVLLAFQPEDRVERWLARVAESHSFSRESLDRDLARIRKRGFRRAPSSFVEGITDLGTPIFDGAASGAIASLTIPFVRRRSDKRDVQKVIEWLQGAAMEISNALSARTGSAPCQEIA